MPQIAAGGNATFAVPNGYTVDVQCPSGWVQLEYPVGTKVFEGNPGASRTFGPYPGGSAKLTSISGAIYYEVDAPTLTSVDPAIIGIIGDSRAAQSYVSSGVAPSSTLRSPPFGPVGWACFLSQGRIRSGSSYNRAVSGSLVSDLMGQLERLMAVTPRCTHVFILTGTNTFVADGKGDQAWAQLSAVLTAIRTNGMQAIVCLDLPRTADASWTAARYRNSWYYNQLVRRFAVQQGAQVIDAARYIADPASSTGNPLPNYTYDGIHPATNAAYFIGKELNDAVLSRLLTPALPGFTSRADTFDATNNPLGNCTPFGLFTGTSGRNVSSAGAASGSVADGWHNRTLTGTGTADASLVARTDKSGNWQQVVYTSGSGVSTYRFGIDSALLRGSDYPSSGSLVLECDLDVSSGSGIEEMGIAIHNFDGASTLLQGSQAFGSTMIASTYYPMPSAFSGRVRTDVLPINESAPQLLIRFECRINTGAATVRIGNLELRPA